MARSVETLLPEASVFVPGAPEPVIERRIVEAARRLCTALRCWRTRDTFSLSATLTEPLVLYPDAQIFEFTSARMNGAELTPVTTEWLDDNEPGWREMTTGDPQFITQLEHDTLAVIPCVPGTLELEVVLRPARNATTLPDFLVDHFGTEIGKAAAGLVMEIPNQTFSNLQLAAVRKAEFERWIAGSRPRLARGQQRAVQRSKPNWF